MKSSKSEAAIAGAVVVAMLAMWFALAGGLLYGATRIVSCAWSA